MFIIQVSLNENTALKRAKFYLTESKTKWKFATNGSKRILTTLCKKSLFIYKFCFFVHNPQTYLQACRHFQRGNPYVVNIDYFSIIKPRSFYEMTYAGIQQNRYSTFFTLVCTSLGPSKIFPFQKEANATGRDWCDLSVTCITANYVLSSEIISLILGTFYWHLSKTFFECVMYRYIFLAYLYLPFCFNFDSEKPNA